MTLSTSAGAELLPMPIQVICPGCHTRFKVSDKFAGKSGACPKCKGSIQVPDADQSVVIHEPEHSEMGAKDAKGRFVLKPVARTDAKFSLVMFIAVFVLAIGVFAVAIAVRGMETGPPQIVMILGALLLAPPLTWAGYTFLKDDELEAHMGRSLAIRTAFCSLAYAGLWGVYAWLYPMIMGDATLETWDPVMIVIIGPILLVGAGAAYVCYDLTFGSGFFHYCLYLLVTVLLRLTMGMTAL